MLLRQTDYGVVAVSQPAHAWLAGLMAQAWGNPRFVGPTPFQDVCVAAGLHDIGWLDWESAPDFDPKTGWPRIFFDVPAVAHTALWRKGVQHVGIISPYAALLVSMHGDTIYEKTFNPATAQRDAAAAVARFLDDQHRFQQKTIAALAGDKRLAPLVSAPHLRFNKSLIAALDTLSLHLCWGVTAPLTIQGVPVSLNEVTDLVLRPDGGTDVIVDPWPFRSDTLTLQVEGRPLQGRFDDAAGLAAALDTAVPLRIAVTLRHKDHGHGG